MKKKETYFGRNVLKEALAAKVNISTIFVETRSAYEFALAEVRRFRLEEKIAFEEGIPKAFSKEAHQGIVFTAAHDFYREYDPEGLQKYSFVLLCNHIQDVHNLGSIVRCGLAFGARLLIHEDERSASITGAAIKSSAGTAFHFSFMKVPNLGTVLKSLQKRDFEVTGLDIGADALSIETWQPKKPLALLLGSEGDGIEPSLRSECTNLVRIPMESKAESLNVSHAAAIVMHWAQSHFRKR